VLSTSPGRAVSYDDDNQQASLPNIALHGPHFNSSADDTASSKTRAPTERAQLGTTTTIGARRSRRFTVGIRPALANPIATGFIFDEAA